MRAATPDGGAGYVVGPVPRSRQPVLDRLAGAGRRPQVHALVEFDVTEAGARIAAAESRVTWTGFLLVSIARAVALHPEVNARKAGNRILSFDRVDVGALVERHDGDRVFLDIAFLRAADQQSCAEATEVLRRTKQGEGTQSARGGGWALVARLPGSVRRVIVRLAGRSPRVAATFGPPVGVTSIGMLTRGWGWAIPLSPLTVIATVGGIVDRPVVHEGRIVARPMLPLTLTFDHAVVDGAPAARFAETLRDLVETAAAFDRPGHPQQHPHQNP